MNTAQNALTVAVLYPRMDNIQLRDSLQKDSQDPFEMDEAEISIRLQKAWSEISSREQPILPLLPGVADGEPKPAAVLIPFLRRQEQWHLLFTLRNNHLPEHSGQVAFPGGRMDAVDPDPIATALREAHEEIGLDSQDVRILGQLPSFQTVTNYRVTPVIGAMPWPYPLIICEEEVERAFTIPLRWLANPEHHEVHHQQLSPHHQPIPVVYFHLYLDELLWGASARFTLTLLEALGLLLPSAE